MAPNALPYGTLQPFLTVRSTRRVTSKEQSGVSDGDAAREYLFEVCRGVPLGRRTFEADSLQAEDDPEPDVSGRLCRRHSFHAVDRATDLSVVAGAGTPAEGEPWA